MTTCECSSCAAGIITAGHCVDIDGDEWHSCAATSPDGQYKVSENDLTFQTVNIEPGDPNNDQMLAYTKEILRALLDVTIHPVIDQAEQQNMGLASMMAALVIGWMESDDQYMTRERLASVLALALFQIANEERVPAGDGKTKRRG